MNVHHLAPDSRPSEIRASPRLIFAELWLCRVCDQLAMLGLSLQHLSPVRLGTAATLTLFLPRCTAVSAHVAAPYDEFSPSQNILCILMIEFSHTIISSSSLMVFAICFHLNPAIRTLLREKVLVCMLGKYWTCWRSCSGSNDIISPLSEIMIYC